MTSINRVDTMTTGSLTGTWNWVLQYNNGFYSGNFTGNLTGDTLTPGSTGISETLTFSPDGEYTVGILAEIIYKQSQRSLGRQGVTTLWI